MSVNAFLIALGMNCFLPLSHNQRIQLMDVISMHPVKNDTLFKKMTPVQVRRSDDKSKLVIVFSESSRFFYQQLLSDSSAERERRRWQYWIDNKTVLTVSFTEDRNNSPFIVRVKK